MSELYKFEELSHTLGFTTLDYLEKMAAAYLKETNLKPSEVELVMQVKGNVWRWWFRRREDIQISPLMQLDDDEEAQ